VVALCSHRHPGTRRAWSQPAANARRYDRRQLEKTPLFGLMAAHLEGWLAARLPRGEPVAGHVEDKFRAYLPITRVHLAMLTERVRRRVIRWFRRQGFLDAAAAADMLARENSGFSVDAIVRITLVDRDLPSCF
jgi:hypothetical protein